MIHSHETEQARLACEEALAENPDLTVLGMESAQAVTSDWRVTFESPNQ